jgi:hypothetical protein
MPYARGWYIPSPEMIQNMPYDVAMFPRWLDHESVKQQRGEAAKQ